MSDVKDTNSTATEPRWTLSAAVDLMKAASCCGSSCCGSQQ